MQSTIDKITKELTDLKISIENTIKVTTSKNNKQMKDLTSMVTRNFHEIAGRKSKKNTKHCISEYKPKFTLEKNKNDLELDYCFSEYETLAKVHFYEMDYVMFMVQSEIDRLRIKVEKCKIVAWKGCVEETVTELVNNVGKLCAELLEEFSIVQTEIELVIGNLKHCVISEKIYLKFGRVLEEFAACIDDVKIY